MRVHVVVPARLASTRLPNKPLADIAGVPMIVRVAAQVKRARADSVIVAVDDAEVERVLRAAGFEAMLTAKDHPSGSDRVMEVAQHFDWPADDIVVNVQGDEPLLPPAVIDQLAQAMLRAPDMEIATLCEPIRQARDFYDPNVVKLVTDRHGKVLYFSRAPIPFPRDATLENRVDDGLLMTSEVRRHIGVYGFRVGALARFVTLKGSRLERIERLEQLRWLEAGGSITALPSVEPVPGGVDTPEDLARVDRLVRAMEGGVSP